MRRGPHGLSGLICALLVIAAGSAVLFSLCPTPQRRFERALTLEKQGKYAAALAEYKRLLPDIPVTENDALSQVQSHMGECYWQLDQPNEALRMFEQAIVSSSHNLAARLHAGEIYLAGGLAQNSAEQATFVLSQQPHNVEALVLLGSAYANLGREGLAVTFWTRALQNDPSQSEIAVRLAELWLRGDHPEKARDVLRKNIAANPRDAQVRVALGRLEEHEGNLPAAEEAYRSAVVASDTPVTNARLAQFLERTGRHLEAELLLRRVDAHNPSLPSALGDLEIVAGQAPNAAQRYLQELERMKSGKRGETDRNVSGIAARLIEADLADVPIHKTRNGMGPNTGQARSHLEQYRRQLDATTSDILEAEIALADGTLALAQSRAQAAVSRSPRSAAAHYVLGITRYSAHDQASARVEWRTAIENDPDFLPARLALGRVCFEADDLPGAEEQLAAVLREEPANLQALLLYSRVLLSEGHHASAAAIAQRAAGLDASRAEPEVVLGKVALQRKQPGTALIYFEKAVLLDPHDQEAIDGLTRVYRSGRVTRPMLRRMETVAGHEPASATLFEVVGRLYADRGWYPDAIRALQSALRLEPKRSTAAIALAQAFAATGRVSAAADSAQLTGSGSGELVAGLEAQKRQDVNKAIAHYEAAVGRGEPTGAAANNLAWLYAQQGAKLDRALTLAQSALEVAPENPAFLDTVGYVHLRRREYSDAIKALKAAVELAELRDPQADLAAFRGHLATAYRLAGQPEAAEKITTHSSVPSTQ